MNKVIISLFFMVLSIFSCKINNKNSFTARIHTPKEETDWYHVIGKTSYLEHYKKFNSINWEKEFEEEYKSGRHNYSVIEVMDFSRNTYLSFSIFPLEDSFQFTLLIGSRSIFNDKGIEEEKGFVRCYLLGSKKPNEVKRFMHMFFKQNYEKLFSEINNLEAIFEVEDLYQNLE